MTPTTEPQARSDLAIRLEALALEHSQGTPAERPSSLPLADLVSDDVFRVRIGDLDEHHLTELGAALKTREELDAVLVMPCGPSFYLVDGRHRLEAYLRAKRTTVPVRYFLGDPKDARAEAIRIGCKVSRPLTTSERMSLAWQNHLSDAYSLRAITRMTGVSKASLDIMARARKDLGDNAVAFSEWWRARKAWQSGGEPERQLTDEEWATLEEERGRQYAERFHRAFGDALRKNSNATAHALGMYLGHKTDEVIERLHQLGYVQSTEDDEADAMF